MRTQISDKEEIGLPDSAIELVVLLDKVFSLPARPPIDIPADQYGLQRAFHDGQRSVIEWAVGLHKKSLEERDE